MHMGAEWMANHAAPKSKKVSPCLLLEKTGADTVQCVENTRSHLTPRTHYAQSH